MAPGVPLRLHPLEHPLIDLRVAPSDLSGGESEQVDDQDPARGLRQVAAVAVAPQMLLQIRQSAEPQGRRFVGRDDEAGPVQLDAGRGEAQVRQQRDRRGNIRPDPQVGMDGSLGPLQIDLQPLALTGALGRHPLQHTGKAPRLADGHADTHRGPVGGVHPGVIRHRVA